MEQNRGVFCSLVTCKPHRPHKVLGKVISNHLHASNSKHVGDVLNCDR